MGKQVMKGCPEVGRTQEGPTREVAPGAEEEAGSVCEAAEGPSAFPPVAQ